MAKYLIQDGSNHVYVWTPELAKRGDMKLYSPGGLAVQGIAEPVGTAPEAASESPAVDVACDVSDYDGVSDIRAKLETIENPDEMVSIAMRTYGVKLSKTMKKSTMIDRVLESVQSRVALP